eukprot:2032670-Alexandrium_andersonii.AAC.1
MLPPHWAELTRVCCRAIAGAMQPCRARVPGSFSASGRTSLPSLPPPSLSLARSHAASAGPLATTAGR